VPDNIKLLDKILYFKGEMRPILLQAFYAVEEHMSL